MSASATWEYCCGTGSGGHLSDQLLWQINMGAAGYISKPPMHPIEINRARCHKCTDLGAKANIPRQPA